MFSSARRVGKDIKTKAAGGVQKGGSHDAALVPVITPGGKN